MESSNFILIINAEQHQNVLIRIISLLNRQHVIITQMLTVILAKEDMLQITLHITENKEKVARMSKRLHREIDVLDINLFEQL
jgi:acetolactate synthase small subunit